MPEPPGADAPLHLASGARLRAARRLLRAKERAETARFLADGPQSVREALRYGVVRELIVAADLVGKHDELVALASAAGIPVVTATEEELASLSEAVTPQGVVAVVDSVDVRFDITPEVAPQLVVICVQIRDPGNAGTIVRCADAFGADAVIMTTGSVELYNPKTVRASVGSIFHLPLTVGADLDQVLYDLRGAGVQILAADGSGADEVDQLAADGSLSRPTAWLLGNEAWGLPAEQLALADRVVRVPLWGKAESLNVSTAAAVCLFATAAAQRRTSPQD